MMYHHQNVVSTEPFVISVSYRLKIKYFICLICIYLLSYLRRKHSIGQQRDEPDTNVSIVALYVKLRMFLRQFKQCYQIAADLFTQCYQITTIVHAVLSNFCNSSRSAIKLLQWSSQCYQIDAIVLAVLSNCCNSPRSVIKLLQQSPQCYQIAAIVPAVLSNCSYS